MSAEEIERLHDLTLPEASGGEIRLGDLWVEQPVVLGWLRHYG